MTQIFSPSWTPLNTLDAELQQKGSAVLHADAVAQGAGCTTAQLQALLPWWDGLPPDAWLKDGGHYRRRRHSCFVLEGDAVRQVPHRAHWQPLQYNALHGGLHRWFEPIEPAMVAQPAWAPLLQWLGRVASGLKGAQPWFIEAHPFRIDASAGIGRPTPEGAHRDGVDLVAVFLLSRVGVKGGETRVFEAEGSSGQRFTLNEPWSVLLLDDARMIHETTPIQPVGTPAYRDTLVVTLRSGAFLGEDAPATRTL